MIASLREDFNRRFTDAKYAELRRNLDRRTRTVIDLRVAETPVFLLASMVREMAEAGAAMTYQLLGDSAYLRAAEATIPAAFRVAGESAHPHFMTADFALVAEADGSLAPRLVELQAFPSVYGYQAVLADEYVRCFGLDAGLSQFAGLDEEAYWTRMRQVVVGEHAPENVILMEVTPEQQKTLPDFRVHEDRLGIRTVDIAAVRQEGRRLLYERDGVWTQVERIYNRAIADEMMRKGVRPGFDLTAELDVEWAGHPNWYFKISKFSVPFLRHPFVPPSVFLDAWFRGEDRERLPEDRGQWILKPLFSFAGKGIEFAPSDDLLRSIPVEERGGYLLQERMKFVSNVDTPFGLTQAEIRILYLWPDGGSLQPVNTLVRLGRGKMMGLDHNRDQLWVGGSAGLIWDDVSGCFKGLGAGEANTIHCNVTPSDYSNPLSSPSKPMSTTRPNPVVERSHPMRGSVRFPLHLPVRLEIEGDEIDAMTEDISATGVLFMMAEAPPIHTRMTWTLRMPAEVMGSKEDVTVSCVGRVVWHASAPQGRQVGVVIDSYRIGERAHE